MIRLIRVQRSVRSTWKPCLVKKSCTPNTVTLCTFLRVVMDPGPAGESEKSVTGKHQGRSCKSAHFLVWNLLTPPPLQDSRVEGNDSRAGAVYGYQQKHGKRTG